MRASSEPGAGVLGVSLPPQAATEMITVARTNWRVCMISGFVTAINCRRGTPELPAVTAASCCRCGAGHQLVHTMYAVTSIVTPAPRLVTDPPLPPSCVTTPTTVHVAAADGDDC